MRTLVIAFILISLWGCSNIESHQLPEFRLERIHDDPLLVVADSLFLTGKLYEAAALFTQAAATPASGTYANARRAEIAYYTGILYGDQSPFVIDSSWCPGQDTSFFGQIALFYLEGTLDPVTFARSWAHCSRNLNPGHYWSRQGNLVLGEYYKNFNFNRDSTVKYFQLFLENSNTSGAHYYDTYWCYERLGEVMTYTRDHLRGIEYVNNLQAPSQWVCMFDNVHMANALIAKAYLIFRQDYFEQALALNERAMQLLGPQTSLPVYQRALKSGLVVCQNWPNRTLFDTYADRMEANIKSTGRDYVNFNRFLAVHFQELGQYEKASPCFERALDYCFSQRNLNVPEVQMLSFCYSEVLEDKGEFEKALDIYHISDTLQRRHAEFEDIYSWPHQGPYMFVSYARYASIYLQWSRQSHDERLLQYSKALALKADSIVTTLASTDEDVFLTLLHETQPVPNVLAGIALESYRQTQEPVFIAQYFSQAERMYGNLQWRDVLSEQDSLLLPLVQTEQRLRSRLKQLSPNDMNTFSIVQDSLRQIRAGIVAIEPSYSALIHDAPSLPDLQERLRADSSLLLMLNVIQNENVTLMITSDTMVLSVTPRDPTFVDDWSLLKAYMHGDSMTTAQTYGRLAQDVAVQLGLDSPVFRDAANVLILTDAYFSGVSFDALITEDSISTTYGSMPFLVYTHTFATIPSAKWYLFRSSREVPASVTPVVAFSWSDEYTLTHPGDSLPELFWAMKEVEFIQGMFPGTQCYKGRSCTKENFIAAYTNPSVHMIHVATHAQSESSARDAVQLYFRNGRNIDTLTAYELMALKSSVDCIILSACEAGTGKYERGDAQFSFPRYLLLNGAQSVVAPMWRVDDRASRHIFEAFYRANVEYPKKGLRQSKLKYLSSDVILDAHKQPCQWAGLTALN